MLVLLADALTTEVLVLPPEKGPCEFPGRPVEVALGKERVADLRSYLRPEVQRGGGFFVLVGDTSPSTVLVSSAMSASCSPWFITSS